MKNIAVILAGGIGRRAGEGLPKQLRPLEDGRTLLQTCVEAFQQCRRIDAIVVVMHPDWIEQARAIVPDDITIIAGGKERWQSSWNAIRHSLEDGEKVAYSLEDAGSACYRPVGSATDEVNILFHDCARPFVSQRILNDVCAALEQHEAVTVAIPATDTMYVVNGEWRMENGEWRMENRECTLTAIPDRKTMFRAQTPQAFRLKVVQKAYEQATQSPNVQATDDCGIVHQYMPDVPIYIVNGEEQNRKITFKEDLPV